MIEHRATLLVDKKFEGGLNLKKGTPIFVWRAPSGDIGHFYPDPKLHFSHSFALYEGDYSLWVRAQDDEPYLVLSHEDPPNEAELARIREEEIHRARKAVDFASKRLGELTAELEALLYVRT